MTRDRLKEAGVRFSETTESAPEPTNPYLPPCPGRPEAAWTGVDPMYIRPELSPSSDSEAFFTQLTHFNTLLSELDAHLASAMRARAATAESASDSNAATLERCEAAVSSTRRECARELTALQRLATDAARRAQFATSASGLQDRLRAQAAAENAAAKEGRARAARQYRIVHPAASAAEAERAVSADTQVFAAALNVDKAKVSSVAREVQRRHEEIVRLEKSMLELAQMLAEVAELVRMQDDMVREVEENAEDLDRDLEKANRMLDAAKMSAEGARKKKRTCIIICVIIAIILLIALLVGVIVPTIKK